MVKFPISTDELADSEPERGWKQKGFGLAEWPGLKFDHHHDPQDLEIQMTQDRMAMTAVTMAID